MLVRHSFECISTREVAFANSPDIHTQVSDMHSFCSIVQSRRACYSICMALCHAGVAKYALISRCHRVLYSNAPLSALLHCKLQSASLPMQPCRLWNQLDTGSAQPSIPPWHPPSTHPGNTAYLVASPPPTSPRRAWESTLREIPGRQQTHRHPSPLRHCPESQSLRHQQEDVQPRAPTPPRNGLSARTPLQPQYSPQIPMPTGHLRLPGMHSCKSCIIMKTQFNSNASNSLDTIIIRPPQPLMLSAGMHHKANSLAGYTSKALAPAIIESGPCKLHQYHTVNSMCQAECH